MFKAPLSTLAAGVALAIGSIGAANALELTAGNYKISFDNYDSGTTNYGNFLPGTFTQVCTDVLGCDAAPGITEAPGSVGSNASADTMGILSVSSIFNITTNTTEYLKGAASSIGGVTVGPYLTGIFSNLEDHNVLVTCPPGGGACTTDARAVGGIFSLWNNPADFSQVNGPLKSVTTDLNALLYPGITNPGNLFLSGVFAAGGAIAGDLTTSYASTFNNNSISGSGFGALDFTGGDALAFFNNDGYTNVNNLKNDAYLTASYNPSAAAPNWTVISTGQVLGDININVPEPGSLALVALALLGVAGVTRRAKR